MTTLHSPNGNCVAALQPAPGDLFVVALLAGRPALVRAAQDYEQVLGLANAFATGTPAPKDSPITIKVYGATLKELLRLIGTSFEDFVDYMKNDEAGLRELAVQTCRDVLVESNDVAARRDARDLLVSMGKMP